MKLFNTLTQSKEEFKSINPKKILMYVCGVTPYDTTHLGHAATYLFFDIVKRFLEFKGYQVEYTQNVTDVDDSLLEKASQVNQNWKELGNFWVSRFLEDLDRLNVALPTHFVYATDFIPTMIKIIKKLLEKGIAYEKNGDIYFEVSKFPEYGNLSKYNRAQMLIISKERGADPNDPQKKDPLDFLLWQASKKGEPSWDSPWGKGRPGWHIECTSMILDTLGEQIDIHGGGRDLVFPHHESEIAQSQSYTGKSPFVKYWMHLGMVMYQGEKMSKSLGNLVLVADLLKKYSANALRWYLLSHNYRIPWEYSEEELCLTEEETEKIFAQALKIASPKLGTDQYSQEFLSALEDDMSTPRALEVIKRLFKEINSKKDKKLILLLSSMLEILGFSLY